MEIMILFGGIVFLVIIVAVVVALSTMSSVFALDDVSGKNDDEQ